MLNKNKGTTLIEVLIASLILSIGLMGFMATQMKTIFDVDTSTKLTHISTQTADFTDFYTNKITKSKKESVSDIKSFYTNNQYWGNKTLTSTNCNKKIDLDDPDLCTESEMADYKINTFKEIIKSQVPDATFLFKNCNFANGRMCLTIAWSGSSNDETSCKTNTTSCYYIEF